jgi:hypothetical protein
MQQGLGCPQCGAPVAGNQQFCGICGTKLSGTMQPQPATCTQCGNPLTPGQQFCATCGTKLPNNPQPAPVQQMAKPAPQPRVSVIRTTQVASQIPTVPQGPVAAAGATRIKNPDNARASTHKYGLLRLGATIIQILGWITLVGGIVASLAIAVFILIGGQLVPIWGGSPIDSSMAITIALVGLIASIIYGIAFLAAGQLCSAVADMTQKL